MLFEIPMNFVANMYLWHIIGISLCLLFFYLCQSTLMLNAVDLAA